MLLKIIGSLIVLCRAAFWDTCTQDGAQKDGGAESSAGISSDV